MTKNLYPEAFRLLLKSNECPPLEEFKGQEKIWERYHYFEKQTILIEYWNELTEEIRNELLIDDEDIEEEESEFRNNFDTETGLYGNEYQFLQRVLKKFQSIIYPYDEDFDISVMYPWVRMLFDSRRREWEENIKRRIGLQTEAYTRRIPYASIRQDFDEYLEKLIVEEEGAWKQPDYLERLLLFLIEYEVEAFHSGKDLMNLSKGQSLLSPMEFLYLKLQCARGFTFFIIRYNILKWDDYFDIDEFSDDFLDKYIERLRPRVTFLNIIRGLEVSKNPKAGTIHGISLNIEWITLPRLFENLVNAGVLSTENSKKDFLDACGGEMFDAANFKPIIWNVKRHAAIFVGEYCKNEERWSMAQKVFKGCSRLQNEYDKALNSKAYLSHLKKIKDCIVASGYS